MSSNSAPTLLGHPFLSYTQAGAAFAIPQLLQMDKSHTLDKMGLEEESPATDDLLQHISSLFTAQDAALSPAKAIVSLLLGLSTQVDKLSAEVRSLAARHTADVTHINGRINRPTPPVPALPLQARGTSGKQAKPSPHPPSRPSQAKSSPPNPSTGDDGILLEDPIETIDAHGNRRRLTYAEKAALISSRPRPAGPPPQPRNQTPRKPTAPPAAKSNLPSAQRRFFASRTTPAPFTNHQQLEAKLPSELGRVLAQAGLAHPHTSLQVQINRNGTVTCTASPSTPAKDIAPYFPGLLAVLNLACNATENPFSEFRLAPTDTDYAIHNVPLFALPEQQDLFTPLIAEAVALATEANITRARFLSRPENRAGKATTSIVVSVPIEDNDKIGEQVRLFGRSRRCSKLWPASPNTLCRKCARLGHATEGCQASSPACSICSGSHLRKDHRCPNPACPKEGHLRPVTDCTPCASYNPKCINCNGSHPASSLKCPNRSTRTSPAPPPPANLIATPPSLPVIQTAAPAPQSESVAATAPQGIAEADIPMTN